MFLKGMLGLKEHTRELMGINYLIGFIKWVLTFAENIVQRIQEKILPIVLLLVFLEFGINSKGMEGKRKWISSRKFLKK